MGILSWIVVGMIAGWLAGVIVRAGGQEIFIDLLVGTTGAVLGGYLTGALFHLQDPISRLNLSTLFVAFFAGLFAVIIVRSLPENSPV